MFELEGNQEQAVHAYQQVVSSLHFLRPVSISVTINQDNWNKHLGNTSCYQSYLSFFDDEIKHYGTQLVLRKYLNTMPPSIHSQLQPLVHLAFGLEHDLPLMVSEGLAYLASTMDDASPWLVSTTTSSTHPRQSSFDYLLFDCIQSDPRFNGVMEGGRPVAAKVKLLLKNHGPLLQNYLLQWLTLDDDLNMDELMAVVLRMMSQNLVDKPTHQLLASIVAIRSLTTIWTPHRLSQWIQVQGLLMMCTFIVQHRPNNNTRMDTVLLHQEGWAQCIQSFMAAGPPPGLILAMRSLWKTQQWMMDDSSSSSSSLILANALVASLEKNELV
ncbi:hypothetical protein BC941DRAFT_432395 [Chlamydoabsidia padenii]|nr:hypothetical protein BC941DRAFT_432395 [Chlamydoabsidia padenii]